jgi:hypothetical protein
MRVANRPLAFILAAALLACSVIIIVEVIGFAVDHSPLLVPWTTWYAWASGTRWDASVVRVWAAVLIVIGLVLVGLEVKRRRATRLPLGAADQATDAAVTRRGLARMLRPRRPESTGSPGLPPGSAAGAPASRRPPAPAARPRPVP